MIEDKDYLIGENEYGKYCVPISSTHRPAAKRILNGEVWEEDAINYIRENFKDKTIIHAGTYFGDFLPALSQSCKKIYAFEPIKLNYECAKKTIELNNITNVELHEYYDEGAMKDDQEKRFKV